MRADRRGQQAARPGAAAAGGARPPRLRRWPPPRRRALAGFDAADPATWGTPGRNDPCPCGSGEKFKHCHGRLS